MSGFFQALRRFHPQGAVFVVGALLVAAGCGSSAKPARSGGAAASALHAGPVTDFVPAAGLRWLIVARLAELVNAPELKASVESLFPPSRLDAFQLSSGLDLRAVPTGLVAGFDYATLYVAETPGENSLVEAKFRERLVLGVKVEAEDPRVRRSSGTAGLVPQSLVRIDGLLVAVSLGDPTLARVVELYARGRLARSPTALAGSALSTLPRDLDAAPLRFYAAGPFSEDWTRGARGLLGATLAAGASVTPEPGALSIRVVLSGTWQGEDVGRLLAAWGDLAESGLGRLLGLDQPLSPPHVSVNDRHLSLAVRLSLGPLVSGLRAAVVADVWEILRIGPPKPAQDPDRPLSP